MKTTNLKQIRNERGLSQAELSNKSGVAVTLIQRYEQRVRDINKAEALRVYQLAEALECSVGDILEIDK